MIDLQFYLRKGQKMVLFQQFRTLYQLPGQGREVYRGIVRTLFNELPELGAWDLHWDTSSLSVEVVHCRRIGALFQVDLMATGCGKELAALNEKERRAGSFQPVHRSRSFRPFSC